MSKGYNQVFDIYNKLPKRVHKVCVISNRPYFTRDYSDFIDSCDVVIRVNRMSNLCTQLTGSKTDIALVDCWKVYMNFSRQQRNTDILHKIPHVLFFPNNTGAGIIEQYLQEEKFTNWSFFPPALQERTPYFTTVTRAIAFAEWLYPEAKIYFLGDSSVRIRTKSNSYHTQSGDDNYQRELIVSGKMIPIMEEDQTVSTYRFSSCIPPEKQLNANKRILQFSPSNISHTILNMQHPSWQGKLLVAGKAACRASNDKDTATILNYTDTRISLKWDKWGVEHFQRNNKGIYVLQQ